MSATLELAKELISLPSVTPQDCGCQQIIADRLAALGFRIENLPFGEVTNLWAEIGDEGPLFVFAGHTDVVPPGPLAEWSSDPFTPHEHDGVLYGRGAADMKGSLAAMITATECFLEESKPRGRIGFLLTSDEEGMAIDGTRRVIEDFKSRGRKIDYCLVGEPSSSERIGDTIKIGRRGSLSAKMTILGVKGHVAYPHLASNPIHNALPALQALTARTWDQGNEAFPPTTLQISNIHAGVGANNVIPGSLEIDFNLRFSTEIDAEFIKDSVAQIIEPYGFQYDIRWHLSGEPFLNTAPTLLAAVESGIETITGSRPQRSTSGGTSDGRFIAPTGTEVIELGPCNASIHKINEHVRIADLERLANIYQAILERIA